MERSLQMKNLMPIMLIEDDRADAILVKRAMKDSQITNPLVHVINCEEALEYLRTQNNLKPLFILTDLNAPGMDSLEFLSIIKADDILSQIPAIVLSGSDAEEDITQSFKLGVSGYMVKLNDYKGLAQIISVLHQYWTLSKVPGNSSDFLLNQPDTPKAVIKQ